MVGDAAFLPECRRGEDRQLKRAPAENDERDVPRPAEKFRRMTPREPAQREPEQAEAGAIDDRHACGGTTAAALPKTLRTNAQSKSGT